MLPMSGSRHLSATNANCKSSVSPRQQHRSSGVNRVLAERNPAVVAVGAWVEGGHDYLENPSALALLTEEIQAERRRENEATLRRFQNEVQHRVAQQVQLHRKKQQQLLMNHDRPVQHQHNSVWTHHVPAGETLMSAGGLAHHRIVEKSFQESNEDTRQVRLRLAACRKSSSGGTMSKLPGNKWRRHDFEGEEEEEEGGDPLLVVHHECPLVKQKVTGTALWDSGKPPPDSESLSSISSPRVLWPLTDPGEELKRQRQSHFLMHRRLCMDAEREQVKENQQHRKHMKRTVRIKAEKEHHRLEEERRLERIQQLTEAKQRPEEKEELILERLKLEEEEERAANLQRRKEEKKKVDTRYVEALRAQMKERLSQEKLELPPLCFCASSFLDSHPETCANNCIFHNNPEAYAKALHSTMLSLDLQ